MGMMKEEELCELLNDKYCLMLEIEDWKDDFHDTVRDWVENAVFVEQDDLSPNQMKEIEQILVKFEANE